MDWGQACEPKDWGLIPSQGTCMGAGQVPSTGAHETQPHIDVSLPLSFPCPLSLKKDINKILKRRKKEKNYIIKKNFDMAF